MHPVPASLRGIAFTTAHAERVGVPARVLRGSRFVAIHRGVYRTRDTEPTLHLLVQAALLVLPPDAAVSHLTNLRLRGVAYGPLLPLHFATNSPHHVKRDGLQVHRHRHVLNPTVLDGFPAFGPRRTFVDAATLLDDRRLLAVGDWLVQHGHVDVLDLRAYVIASHLDGVRRARRVAPLVREGSASVRESGVRWALHRAGLPDPELNVDIADEHGRWLARGDLVYRHWKVLVEYDGWQHERDAKQRQWDHLRREQLEAADQMCAHSDSLPAQNRPAGRKSGEGAAQSRVSLRYVTLCGRAASSPRRSTLLTS